MIHTLLGNSAAWGIVLVAFVGVSAAAILIESALDWLFDEEDV